MITGDVFWLGGGQFSHEKRHNKLCCYTNESLYVVGVMGASGCETLWGFGSAPFFASGKNYFHEKALFCVVGVRFSHAGGFATCATNLGVSDPINTFHLLKVLNGVGPTWVGLNLLCRDAQHLNFRRRRSQGDTNISTSGVNPDFHLGVLSALQTGHHTGHRDSLPLAFARGGRDAFVVQVPCHG